MKFCLYPNQLSLVQIKASHSVVFGIQKQTPIKQLYLVRHDGSESEVELEIPFVQREWLSLGRFYFSPGEASVILTDKNCTPDQVIYADAVKWVYEGEK